jgi:hypothetical protein
MAPPEAEPKNGSKQEDNDTKAHTLTSSPQPSTKLGKSIATA